MAYINWWNRTGPITMGERFGLNEISTRAKTLSPTKSYTEDRIDMKPGGIVEPGVTNYGSQQTSTVKKATYYKKLLENLPEGYYNEYVENFYTVNKDTGKLTHVSGGPEGKGIPYMEKKYGDIIKETYTTRQGETQNLNRKVRDINAAIKQSISDKIESGLKASRQVRKEDLKIIGNWQPTAPKGYVTHHFMPLAGVEGESLNLASTKNTAFISKELNSKMAPYDTKLKANQKEQIKLLKEKSKGWEKRIEELNFKAKNIYKEAAKKVPGSSGYLGYSQYIKQSDGSYVPKVTGIDSNKSLAGLKGKEIFYKNISPENKLKVNKMSNITEAAETLLKNQNLALPKAETSVLQKAGKALTWAGKKLLPIMAPGPSHLIHGGKYDVTSGSDLTTMGFWNSVVKAMGKTSRWKNKQIGLAKRIKDLAWRGLIPTRFLPYISGTAAVAAGPMLIKDAAEWLQSRY